MTTSKPKDPKRKPRPARNTRFAGEARQERPSSKAGPNSSSPQILTVVAETDHYVILDKPALLDSQNSKEGRDSVVDWLKNKYGFSGLVHRLDFGTSGAMVAAKTPESAKKLTLELQEGRIGRTYTAITFGKNLPDSGIWSEDLDEQSAVTHFKTIERFANAALVEVTLETGRKHQIRKHFSCAGFPLLGDHLYGKRGSDRLFHRPALHASAIEVMGKRYNVKLPEDFNALLTKLRSTRS